MFRITKCKIFYDNFFIDRKAWKCDTIMFPDSCSYNSWKKHKKPYMIIFFLSKRLKLIFLIVPNKIIINLRGFTTFLPFIIKNTLRNTIFNIFNLYLHPLTSTSILICKWLNNTIHYLHTNYDKYIRIWSKK